jgi:hypothetical protein
METFQQIQLQWCYLNLLGVVAEDWQHPLRYGQQIETLLIFEGIFNLKRTALELSIR